MSTNNARTRAIRAHARATGLSYMRAMRDLDAKLITPAAPPTPGVDWDAIISAPHTAFGAGPAGPLLLDWATNPHLLVTGRTGAGKSWSVQNLLAFGLLRGDDVYVSDMTKGGVDYEFAAPWTKAVATTPDETLAMLTAIDAELTRRNNLVGAHGARSYSQLPAAIRPPHALVILDEASTLRLPAAPALDSTEDAETVAQHADGASLTELIKRILTIVWRIARTGRSAGITLIIAAQHLSETDLVPGAAGLASNLTRVMFGSARTHSCTARTQLGSDALRGRSIIELRDGYNTSTPVIVDVADIGTDELRAALEARVPRLAPGHRLDLSAV